MEVTLIAHTPEPDRLCALAALSTTSRELATTRDVPKEKLEASLRHVLEMGHHSVIEHAYFTFAISGISRACSHELVRHRIASYSQQSQRYVRLGAFEFVRVPKIDAHPELKAEYEKTMASLAATYQKFLDAGIPPEDARYVLPNATKTNLVMSMDARSLMNFFTLRCCGRAQWEIRGLANRMLEEVKKVAPIIFEKAGARCDSQGHCPEGARSCGRSSQKSNGNTGVSR